MATVAAHAADSVTIGDRTASPEDAADILGERLDSLPPWIRETNRVSLGVYRGLRFGLVLHPQFAPDLYLEGAVMQQSLLARDHHGPRAILNALDRLAHGFSSECERIRQELAIAETQLRDYQTRRGLTFGYETYLARLAALRDQLKASLSTVAEQ